MVNSSITAGTSPASPRGQHQHLGTSSPAPQLWQEHRQALLTSAHADISHAQRGAAASCKMCPLKETFPARGRTKNDFRLSLVRKRRPPLCHSPSILMLLTNAIVPVTQTPPAPWQQAQQVGQHDYSDHCELCDFQPPASFFLSPLPH